ncbi:hypothetical protein GCM10028818_57480 [Spirosoma horti]
MKPTKLIDSTEEIKAALAYANSGVLYAELGWLSAIIDARIKQLLENTSDVDSTLKPPDLPDKATPYSKLVGDLKLSPAERLLLILALAPHLRPEVLDPFFRQDNDHNRGYTQFGGMRGKHNGGFLPTGETALFLLVNGKLGNRLELIYELYLQSILFSMNVLRLGITEIDEPPMSGTLSVTPAYLALLTTGKAAQSNHIPDFPAQLVTTQLDWDDLLLDEQVMDELKEMETWLTYQSLIMQHPTYGKHLKPGYRALFYGPPGTGKTLTACLLGKKTNHPVYRIDLSMIVSKFVGETEKNLARVFDMAQHHQWILFFDEADALFGKRTTTASANDRYANQEVSYLLQRIEDFPGVIVLASNQKANLDEALSRRFQVMIHFPIPSPEQRRLLWQSIFTSGKPVDEAAAEAIKTKTEDKKTQELKDIVLAEDVDFEALADEYALTGGSIINVLRYCVLVALANTSAITLADIINGIRRELAKEAKTLLPAKKSD